MTSTSSTCSALAVNRELCSAVTNAAIACENCTCQHACQPGCDRQPALSRTESRIVLVSAQRSTKHRRRLNTQHEKPCPRIPAMMMIWRLQPCGVEGAGHSSIGCSSRRGGRDLRSLHKLQAARARRYIALPHARTMRSGEEKQRKTVQKQGVSSVAIDPQRSIRCPSPGQNASQRPIWESLFSHVAVAIPLHGVASVHAASRTDSVIPAADDGCAMLASRS